MTNSFWKPMGMLLLLLSIDMVLVSCGGLGSKNNSNSLPNCGHFMVKLTNNDMDRRIFFSNLKRFLEEKLKLIESKNNNKKRGMDSYVPHCELLITVEEHRMSSMIGNAGDVSRENHRINVHYEIRPILQNHNYTDHHTDQSADFQNIKVFRSSVSSFYSIGNSNYGYSDYVSAEREASDNARNIAEDIFVDMCSWGMCK